VLSDLTCNDLERSFQGHVDLNGRIPGERYMLGPRIALTADRKLYAGNPMVLSDLTWDDFERLFQGHMDLNMRIPGERCMLGSQIASTADSRPYTGESNGAIRFVLQSL